jgi:hypothetical protein
MLRLSSVLSQNDDWFCIGVVCAERIPDVSVPSPQHQQVVIPDKPENGRFNRDVNVNTQLPNQPFFQRRHRCAGVRARGNSLGRKGLSCHRGKQV